MSEIWQNAIRDIWGIDASLTRLDGEYDLNFLVEAERDYVLKVMRVGCSAPFIDMQVEALEHLRRTASDLPVPAVIPTVSGQLIATVQDADGAPRLLWLLEELPGRTYALHRPHDAGLIHALGAATGAMDAAMEPFTHPELNRSFKWNLMQAGWVADNLDTIKDPDQRALITDITREFESILPALQGLPQQAIHNDINDYNILVSGTLTKPSTISGLIDFGDMCAAPRICNLAIAAAYVVLGHEAPEQALSALVAGYHSTNPLAPQETDLLWPLLRARLAVSVVNSTLMAVENPDDPYVTISQAPAWAFLESHSVNAGLINARLRVACGFPVTDSASKVLDWLGRERGTFSAILGRDLTDAPMGSLAVENIAVPQNPFAMTTTEAGTVGAEYGDVWLGHYNEPRLIYTADAFRNGPWKASDRRTVHIAVDGFMPAGTPVHTPMAAVVEFWDNRQFDLDYGGMVILRHQTPDGDTFYTLYGHLDPDSIRHLNIGQPLEKGEVFAALGDQSVNGGWIPHVHFQLALTTEGMGIDWPGVADPEDLNLWNALCPNPAALMNLPDEKTAFQPVDKSAVLQGRRAHFGANLSLTYVEPVMFLRGWKHHLFDEWGRPYLDAYNNVPHVGHAHPRIQAVAADQLKRMNSNTRYLHPAQTAFADKILSKMPKGLGVCFFVNSGTEANELALRLARAHTGGKDMVTPDHGYHGNTTGAIDVSAYKFNAPGGVGQADWVHLVEVADEYRGSFRRDDPDRAVKFATCVDEALTKIKARNGKLAGFIAETYPSVGGQIIPPPGYLKEVYARIRAANGLCIADEVQTGLGRLGSHYFAFEEQGVVPDIVVMGKPIGNGHPLGVVVTTREIADSFAKGPEFFSTFGGSTLSCRIGLEVLQIVDDEGLMENARVMGQRLLDGLRDLQEQFETIGDVRGMGLFIGLDLVSDRDSRAPATSVASYIKNRMRQHRILMGSEGPADNILKIRPPLTIDADGVDMILAKMAQVLGEVAVLAGKST